MIQDELGLLKMEASGYPPNIGDSCAETSRWLHLLELLHKDDNVNPDILYKFMTDKGFVRHPNAPERDTNGDSWREDDFTSDQGLPLYLAAKSYDLTSLENNIKTTIKSNYFRTGNGDFVNPIFFAVLINSKWLLNIVLFFQILVFKFPFRWSDSKKQFERSEGSSADYLNFIHALFYSSKWVRKFVNPEKLLKKVIDYYKDEPNSKWIMDLYYELLFEQED